MPILTQSVTVPQPAAGTGPFATSYALAGAVTSHVIAAPANSVGGTTQTAGDLLVGKFLIFTTGPVPTFSGFGAAGTSGWKDSGAGLVKGVGNQWCALWYGKVTNAQATTFTASYTTSGATNLILVITEFTCGSVTPSTTWSADKNGSTSGTAASTPLATLAPTAASPELYVGGGTYQQNNASSGGTAGFSYYGTPTDFEYNCYDLNVTGAVSPIINQSPSGTYLSASGLFNAIIPSTVIGPATVRLQAVPTGRVWVVSQIGFEFLPTTALTNITADIILNGRVVKAGINVSDGNYQGPPYIRVASGDDMYINFNNAPVGSSAIVNFFYNEYSATAQPHDIGGLI